jgi:hypothetical protein
VNNYLAKNKSKELKMEQIEISQINTRISKMMAETEKLAK